MMTIHKFPLIVADRQTIAMPPAAVILTVQVQRGIPCVWVMLNPDEVRVPRTIMIHGTGHEFAGTLYRHIGTFQLDGGSLVFHAFEVLT
jgi:hypothetical protein